MMFIAGGDVHIERFIEIKEEFQMISTGLEDEQMQQNCPRLTKGT